MLWQPSCHGSRSGCQVISVAATRIVVGDKDSGSSRLVAAIRRPAPDDDGEVHQLASQPSGSLRRQYGAEDVIRVALGHAWLGVEPVVHDPRPSLRVFPRLPPRDSCAQRGTDAPSVVNPVGISIRSSPTCTTRGSPRIQNWSSPGRISSPTTAFTRSTRSKRCGLALILAVSIFKIPSRSDSSAPSGLVGHPSASSWPQPRSAGRNATVVLPSSWVPGFRRP